MIWSLCLGLIVLGVHVFVWRSRGVLIPMCEGVCERSEDSLLRVLLSFYPVVPRAELGSPGLTVASHWVTCYLMMLILTVSSLLGEELLDISSREYLDWNTWGGTVHHLGGWVPGLNEREKTKPECICPCFLTEYALWPITSSFCCHAFPAPSNWEPQWTLLP